MALVPCPGQRVTPWQTRRRRGQRRGEQRIEEASWNLRVRQCGHETPMTAQVGALDHEPGAPCHENPHTTMMDHPTTHEKRHAKVPPAFAALPRGWSRSGARHGKEDHYCRARGPRPFWPEAVLQPHLVATTEDGSALGSPSPVRPDQWRQSSRAGRVPFASRGPVRRSRRGDPAEPSIAETN